VLARACGLFELYLALIFIQRLEILLVYLIFLSRNCLKPGKNDFVEISKNLGLDTNLKIVLLDYQNYYVGCSSSVKHSSNRLSILHNYFNSLMKLSSDLYLIKILNTLGKSFFP